MITVFLLYKLVSLQKDSLLTIVLNVEIISKLSQNHCLLLIRTVLFVYKHTALRPVPLELASVV